MPLSSIPSDFPRRTILSGLSGAVPKFSARKLSDGTYSTFVSDDEHLQAYENAEDCAQQLKDYALRKEQENPDWTREFNLERIKKGIESKVQENEWDFTPHEIAWIMKRIVELLAPAPEEHAGLVLVKDALDGLQDVADGRVLSEDELDQVLKHK